MLIFVFWALRENLWVNRVRLPAWTGWTVWRHGLAGRFGGMDWLDGLAAWIGWTLCRARTNIVPKPRDSASEAGLADTYLASPAQPRIRIGLGTTVARVLPAERPETCSRPPGVRRLRSAFGRVRRSRRAADAVGWEEDRGRRTEDGLSRPVIGCHFKKGKP